MSIVVGTRGAVESGLEVRTNGLATAGSSSLSSSPPQLVVLVASEGGSLAVPLFWSDGKTGGSWLFLGLTRGSPVLVGLSCEARLDALGVRDSGILSSLVPQIYGDGTRYHSDAAMRHARSDCEVGWGRGIRAVMNRSSWTASLDIGRRDACSKVSANVRDGRQCRWFKMDGGSFGAGKSKRRVP